MDTKQKHLEMVLRLAKPGAVILKELTPFDCDLVHMGGCLAGEAGELYEAYEMQEPLTEEAGDLEFYLAKVRHMFDVKRTGKLSDRPMGVRERLIELMVLGDKFWDVVKRVTIYRKGVDAVEKSYNGKTILQQAVWILESMEAELNSVYAQLELTLDEVLEANYTKLADKDKGRYASGTYSDEQAQARRDKTG